MNEAFKEHLMKSIRAGTRTGGRKLDEYRDVEIELGVSSTAEGSARVKLGDTEVIAGIKMMVGTPYPDEPAKGTIMVGAELLPLSSPDFESGPPSEKAIEIARVTDRGIRESGALDVSKLCIREGELVWIISVDVCTINEAGNLQDAAALATVAAMHDTRLPELDGDRVNYKKKTDKKLPFSKLPISVTVYKVGDKLLLDPDTEEEKILDSRLTVAITSSGNLCALQKGGDHPLTPEDIARMIDIAKKRSEDLRKVLQKCIK